MGARPRDPITSNARTAGTLQCVPYGPGAWMVQFAETAGAEAFQRCRSILATLKRHPPAGLIEVVPAFTRILLEFEPGTRIEPASLLRFLERHLAESTTHSQPETTPVVIPVRYDGPDLPRVAAHAGLTIEEVCRRHAAPVYHVHAIGFSPGFPYLGELDPSLHTPRLPSPRPRVPAGSVGIGGTHTGIYSIESPGGWNLIGSTALRLFNPDLATHPDSAPSAFLLKPGDFVRFEIQSIHPGATRHE